PAISTRMNECPIIGMAGTSPAMTRWGPAASTGPAINSVPAQNFCGTRRKFAIVRQCKNMGAVQGRRHEFQLGEAVADGRTDDPGLLALLTSRRAAGSAAKRAKARRQGLLPALP